MSTLAWEVLQGERSASLGHARDVLRSLSALSGIEREHEEWKERAREQIHSDGRLISRLTRERDELRERERKYVDALVQLHERLTSPRFPNGDIEGARSILAEFFPRRPTP